jgi:uncharacterized protein YjbI with pentapeptide repeats
VCVDNYDHRVPTDILAILTVLGRRTERDEVEPQLADLSPEDWQIINIGRKHSRRLDLSDVNLYRAKITHTNLQGVLLTRANLRGTDLSDSDFQGSHLIAANLQRARLASSNLSGAFLLYANLAGAYLTGANLQGAVFFYGGKVSLIHWASSLAR